MTSLNDLLAMVVTEAVEGGIQKHYFDESKNQKPPLAESERQKQDKPDSELPTIRYTLELVKKADGTYEWKK